MIKVTSEDLPKEREAKIRQWLTKPEAAEFLDLVSSRAKQHMANAMNDAFNSSDHNSKMESAIAQVRKAQEYEAACRIFIEFAQSSKPFNTTRLS